MENVQLLLVDPQNDFCDLPGAALPVPGADNDLKRVAGLVNRAGDRLSGIHVTLDTHQPLDVAHPAWWRDRAGGQPAPYTAIGIADLDDGVWQVADPAQAASTRAYLQALAGQGETLIVWPEHCLVGSWGHSLHQGLFRALSDWGRNRLQPVNYVIKGQNPGRERFSAVDAALAGEAIALAPSWLGQLASADAIWVAGEALSHCVANTVRDLVRHLGRADTITLLQDCASPVPGFEALGQAFVDQMQARGMRVADSTALA